MAEQLGTAVLRLEVDAAPLRRGLADARKLVDSISNGKIKLEFQSNNAQAVQKQLRNITTEAERASVRVQTLNQVLNSPLPGSYSKISAQILRLTADSRELSIVSEQYLKVLTRISELETVRSSRTGRQRVIADFEAFKGGVMNGGYGDPSQLPKLPNTTAADIQLINELTARLRNVDRSSADYEITLRQLEAAQLRVSRANNGVSDSLLRLQQQQDGAARRAEKLAAVQQYYAGSNPRAGGVRDANGAMLASGAGALSNEKAYNAAIRPARDLLELDLRRAQTIREISQRILATAEASKGGFGVFSSSLGADPVSKSIRRNAEKTSASQVRYTKQLDTLESDLARVREQRLLQERSKLAADKAEAQATREAARTEQQSSQLKKQRRGQILQGVSSTLIGGAFPALFGQGFGASVGGALGGAIGSIVGGPGGGFAGSLVGTSVGQQADKVANLSKALDAPIAKFSELEQAGILSSRALEKNVQALINAGRFAEAEAKIRQDLAKSGLDAATAGQLAEESDRLQRSLAQLGLNIGLVVQGPMTDLINAFNKLLEPGRVSAQSRAIQAGLSPEDRQSYLARREQLKLEGGLNLVDINKKVNSEFQGRTKQAQQAATTQLQAQKEDNALLSAKYRLIDANVQGYERLALQRERELVVEEKKAAIRQDPNNRLTYETQAAEKLYEIKQRTAELDQRESVKALSTINKIASLREEASTSLLAPGLGANGVQALQALSQFRNAIRDSAEARAAFNANPGNSDLASQAKVAAEAVKTAAAKTRADLLDAYEAARRSAQSISRSVEDLQTSFLQNRTGGQGITRFLSGQALYDTQQATFRSLLPLFEQARAQQSRQFAAEGNFYASAQIAGLNFSGSTAGVNQAMLDFIAAARNDSRIQQDLYTSQVDLARASRDLLLINDLLAKSNAELATAIPTLTTAVSTLAVKDWSVQISVASDGSSAAYGDVLNGAVTQ